MILLALASTAWRLEYAKGRSSKEPLDEYERTLLALNQYRALATEENEDLLPATSEPLSPGDFYSGVPALVRLLKQLGDLPEGFVSDEPELYQGEMVTAVQNFQSRHALEPDGRIGPLTLEQLNTPLSVRVRQLELSLERWRRRPYDPNRPAIVLNLPEFRLRAFGGASAPGSEPELEMKVVVGQAPDRKTPILHSQLEAVIFRPSWNVPASIQRNELVPEIMQDRSWVSENDFELVTRQGEIVGAGKVSDDMLSRLKSGELQLRQKPGPKNSLGLVKFVFPNEYGVYMHDTSAPWLFDRARRDFSHGCIRVEKPKELAAWVLSKQPGWSHDRIAAVVQGTESVSVKIERPIQVVTMYSTAVVMQNGEVDFFPDIYGEDAALEKELATQPHVNPVGGTGQHPHD
ncbi:MAG: L,D-transpeptidase family protein [Bryobacteraceae bacterium]